VGPGRKGNVVKRNVAQQKKVHGSGGKKTAGEVRRTVRKRSRGRSETEMRRRVNVDLVSVGIPLQ